MNDQEHGPVDWPVLLENALQFGLTVEGFWSLTPRETWLAMRAKRAQIRGEHDRAAWLAWHTAYLGRVKRMPPLARLMAPKRATRMTPEEHKARRQEFEEMKAIMGDKIVGRRRGAPSRRSGSRSRKHGQ